MTYEIKNTSKLTINTQKSQHIGAVFNQKLQSLSETRADNKTKGDPTPEELLEKLFQCRGCTLTKEEEAIVATSPISSYRYALTYLKGRFPAGEKAISSDPNAAALYAIYVIKGRYPEGEPAIAKNSEMSTRYAIEAMNARFPGAEKVIFSTIGYAYDYVDKLIGKRTPEAEKAICEYGWTALEYAKKYVKAPFPAGEKAIAEEIGTATEYSKFFDIPFKASDAAEDTIKNDEERSLTYALKTRRGPFPKGEEILSKYGITAYEYARDAIKGRFPLGEKAISEQPAFAWLYVRDAVKGRCPGVIEDAILNSRNPTLIQEYKDFINK